MFCKTDSKTITALLLGWLILAATIAPLTFAQDHKSLTVEETLSAVGFAELTPIGFSSNGKWLAYTIKDYRRGRTVDIETWARSGVRDVFTGTDIWITNVQTGEAKSLTGGKGDNFLPVWSPNGSYLAFLSDRDGSGQARLWIWDTASGGITKLSDVRIRQFGQIEWTPDSQKIIVPVVPDRMPLQEYATKFASVAASQEENATMKAPGSTPTIYSSKEGGPQEQILPKSDAWNLDFWLRDLAMVDRSTGKVDVLVRNQRIAHFVLSPDGSKIAYTVPKRFERPGSQQMIFDLATLTLCDLETKTLAPDLRLDFDGTFNWSPKGSWLIYRTFGPEERVFDCYVVGLNGEKPRNITRLKAQPQWPRYTSNDVLWDPTGEIVYFITDGTLWRSSVVEGKAREVANISDRHIATVIPASGNSLWTADDGKSTVVVAHDDARKQDGFYRIDLVSGESTKILETGQCYTCANSDQPFAVAQDGKHFVFFAEDAQHNADLWIGEPDLATRRQLTHLDPQFERHKQGAARLVNWLTDDGKSLQGALLLPSDYETGKRYPLVVWVYGGASLSNHLDHFGLEGLGPFNMQLLATRGYAVLAPDSIEGFGTAMLDLVKTVLPGVNKVIEMGIADANRLGIMGHSHGGYNTLALIAQTKRFKAAVVVDGLGDLVGSYGGMDKTGSAFGISLAEQGQEKMGGTPWEFRDRYIENSPIFYLDRVDTPVLMVHGSEDTAVPAFLGDEVFVDLRRLGKEVDYVKYNDEGHSPVYWSYPNEVDFCNRLIAWLDGHLKDGSPMP